MKIYRHIGVAVAFSPRLPALLAEVARHTAPFEQRLSLVHAGAQTAEKETQIRQIFLKVGLPEQTQIHWVDDSPETAILEAIEQHDIDLLVAGAMEKESAFRYYLGSVARNLVREAPCSLLLFTEPQRRPQPIRRMVVVTDFSECSMIAFAKALRLAKQENTEQVYVVRVHSTYGEAMVLADDFRRERVRRYQRRTRNEEETLLRDFIDAAGHTEVAVEPVYLEGHAGSITAEFARNHEADLLVMPSAKRHSYFERLFPSHMEWVLREIPCNLWVAREPFTLA